jgi:hypothetical protein
MDVLREAVLHQGYRFYYEEIAAAMAEGRYPAYKASGMFYINFAVREPRLFQYLFMRRRTESEQASGFSSAEDSVIAALMEGTGLSRQAAERFHFSMWMWVHGVAASVAGGFLAYDEKTVSTMLSDVYFGLCARYKEKEKPV